MPKAILNDMYTAVQHSLIDELAKIEQSDRDACEGCGGEDCACCEIYLDRQKWVDVDQLFDEEDYTHERREYELDDNDEEQL